MNRNTIFDIYLFCKEVISGKTEELTFSEIKNTVYLVNQLQEIVSDLDDRYQKIIKERELYFVKYKKEGRSISDLNAIIEESIVPKIKALRDENNFSESLVFTQEQKNLLCKLIETFGQKYFVDKIKMIEIYDIMKLD